VSVPRVLLLALALLQAGGIFDLVRRTTCEEACRQNGCSGDCTPDSDGPQCPCHCPSGATAAPAMVAVATPAPVARPSGVTFDAADQLPASPDPREILHVPRQHAV
jgi:hypothetical protein